MIEGRDISVYHTSRTHFFLGLLLGLQIDFGIDDDDLRVDGDIDGDLRVDVVILSARIRLNAY